jgi:tetratricopeptide (TPR) repeat protein
MDKIMEEKLARANDLREKEQFGESSKLYTNLLPELINNSDYVGQIHCLGGQSLIYKIMARVKKDKIYNNLAIAFAKEAYRIGTDNQNAIDGRSFSIACSSYADTLLTDHNLQEALLLFQKSLEVSTADIPEKARLKTHIGGIKYYLGDKETGINEIKNALGEIRTGDLSAYHIRVWETGCLNGLAKIFAKEGNRDEALKFANESFQITLDHKLTIRQKEVEEIISKINKGELDFSL